MIEKILKALKSRLLVSDPVATNREQCGSDPLAHPVLKAMNARELADIPFPRRRADGGSRPGTT